jgi:hypothetical protein
MAYKIIETTTKELHGRKHNRKLKYHSQNLRSIRAHTIGDLKSWELASSSGTNKLSKGLRAL